MLQEKNTLAELRKHFKLNIYEVKIWLAILTRGIASAGELSDISGVPRSRCYDVLESLEKKGFMIMKIGRPIRYLAVDPATVLERVQKNITEETDELASQIETIKDTEEFRELELLGKSGLNPVDISSMSKSIVGRTNINRHIKEMIAGAVSDVKVVSTEANLDRTMKIIKNVSPLLIKKDIRAELYSPYTNKAFKFKNLVHREHVPSTTFVTVDGKEMLFMVSNEVIVPDFEVAVWIKSPFFVNAMNHLFGQSIN